MVAGRLAGVRPFDWFILVNIALSGVMVAAVYYPTLGGHVGGGGRYFSYLLLFVGLAVPVWGWLRRFDYPTWLLVALEAGILLHFAGGGLEIDSLRLYDQVFFGVRFDKYVHFYNSLVGALGVRSLLRQRGIRFGGCESLVLVSCTLGLGAVVEMVEYAGFVIAGATGMGDYANNMQDLLANVLGSTTAVAALRLARAGVASTAGLDAVTASED